MYNLNAERLEIELAYTFEILLDTENSKEEADEEIRNTLAIAAMEDVPVYPNSTALAAELAKHHRDLLIHGFTAPDGKGGKARLRLTRSPGREIMEPHYLEKVDTTIAYMPAEIALIMETVRDELRRRDSAASLLANLRGAILDLESLLTSGRRNEAQLQECLTENPILFGTDYVQVVPKHKLGSEFEMDYALERISGHFDLVEIEASNLRLFTKSGNPTSYLVHAEQQVLDWLAWIERNSAYAREGLPGVMSPMGFVVIGRRNTLTKTDASKLKKRNAVFRGQLQVLTYDALLDQAKNLLRHLEGLMHAPDMPRRKTRGKARKDRA